MMEEFENYNLNELIELKNNLCHQICIKEFKEKGFKDIIEKMNKPYKLFFRNPLGKNIQWQLTVGIPKNDFNSLMKNNGLINSLKINSNIYYVLDGSKPSGGYTSEHEYIDIKIKDNTTNRWKTLLLTMEEYLKNESEN